MSGYAKARAEERIREVSLAGLDVAGFLDEVSSVLVSAVPNESHLKGPYWYTIDPGSHLITSDYGGDGCALDTSEVMRWEYLDSDVNKYMEVLRNPRRVQTLHEVTGGHPERSRIYREFLASEGLGQEMLVALGTKSGEFWGTVRLNRLEGQPTFEADELRFMAAIAPDLAEGLRRGLIVGEATDPDLPDAPALIIFDPSGEVVSLSPGASDWIERLPGRRHPGWLPAPIASAASAALACACPQDPASGTTALVRSLDGEWVSVHGTVMGSGPSVNAAVIVEKAHPDRIAPLLMSIYGLTVREQEITRLVLRGWPTAQLAARLGISSHTVQQHLKSIFEKVGVRSRPSLMAAMFYESFDARVQDNGRRVSGHRPIRGGPLRTASAAPTRKPVSTPQGGTGTLPMTDIPRAGEDSHVRRQDLA